MARWLLRLPLSQAAICAPDLSLCCRPCRRASLCRSPALQIDKVCLSIQLLLQNPNPEDPLDPTIAKQWRDNNAQANMLAREWTKKYAH